MASLILIVNLININQQSKNMNNGNNSKSVENNMESDVDTTVIILDDTNKINDSKRRTKENLGRQYCKTYSRLGNNKKLDSKQKVYVRQFSGSKVTCMKYCVKPSIRENNPDLIIFHVGTNDVHSDKTPQVIAQSIVDLEKSVTNDNLQVTVSSIVPRTKFC